MNNKRCWRLLNYFVCIFFLILVMLSTKPFREIVKFVRENVIFGRENEKIVRERGFAWERRSQAPGFFPHLVHSVLKFSCV